MPALEDYIYIYIYIYIPITYIVLCKLTQRINIIQSYVLHKLIEIEKLMSCVRSLHLLHSASGWLGKGSGRLSVEAFASFIILA